MSRTADRAGTPEHVPEAESPTDRSAEQEVAAGRTAATPAALLGSVFAIVAVAVVVVLALVVLALTLT